MFEINPSLSNIQNANDCQNKLNENCKNMLKSVHGNEKISSNVNENALNVNSPINRPKRNRFKNTKYINATENLDTNLNISKTVCAKTNQTRNTTVNKKRKTPRSKSNKKNSQSSETGDSADEVEPTYCICEYISYGPMVGCDNDLCPIEWFHFKCVSLKKEPKGKWYCPRCRGTNFKTMKPREVFFKELEEYNRRKEENWSI